MRKIVLCATALFMAVWLGGCNLHIITGSGNVVTEERAVSDFTAVDFSGIGELTIVQGETDALTIETDDNLLPYIQTTVDRGTLTIGFENGVVVPILRPTHSIRYQLTLRTLTDLNLSGAGTAEAATITTDQLTLNQSGAGQITIDDLSADTLAVNLSGAGRVELAGEVTQQTVSLSGLGAYEAGGLASQIAGLSLSGAGSATVWVTEQLDVELSGAGSIRYYGSPQVSADTSGVGNVESLGDR